MTYKLRCSRDSPRTLWHVAVQIESVLTAIVQSKGSAVNFKLAMTDFTSNNWNRAACGYLSSIKGLKRKRFAEITELAEEFLRDGKKERLSVDAATIDEPDPRACLIDGTDSEGESEQDNIE